MGLSAGRLWDHGQNSTPFSSKSNFRVTPQNSKRHWRFSQLSVTTQLSSVVLVTDRWFKLKRYLTASISISNCRAKLWLFFIPIAWFYDQIQQHNGRKVNGLDLSSVCSTATCVEKQFHTWPPCSTLHSEMFWWFFLQNYNPNSMGISGIWPRHRFTSWVAYSVVGCQRHELAHHICWSRKHARLLKFS